MDASSTASKRLARQQRWFFIALAVFFLALNVQYLFKIRDHAHRSALQRWVPQLLDFTEGIDIWEVHHYPNPPIMALILSPLAMLPTGVGALVWFYLKVGMVLLAIRWMLNLLDRPELPFPFWGKALAVLLCLRPIEGDLIHGNVNLFILTLVVGSLYAFARGRDWLAGLALALAIACKVTPALFVPYLLWKRAGRMLGATALGLGLFLWVVPSAFLGWEHNHQCLTSWYEAMAEPYLVESKITSEHQNQSLPGLLTRLLTDSPSFSDWSETGYVPVEFHNLADLDPSTIRRLVQACMALFGLAVIVFCRTPIHDRSHWKLAAEFSVIALGMLLFSERTWKHHGVLLLMPFATLSYAISAVSMSRQRRKALAALVCLSAFLMLTTSSGLSEHLDRLGKLAQVYGAYVWAYVALLSGLLVLLQTPKEIAPMRVEAQIWSGRMRWRTDHEQVELNPALSRVVELNLDEPCAAQSKTADRP